MCGGVKIVRVRKERQTQKKDAGEAKKVSQDIFNSLGIEQFGQRQNKIYSH